MKIIDKTPFQDQTGNISLPHRVQGMLDYGLSWPAELEAQKTVVAQINRVLEKGYTLIRNLTFPKSQITEPLILIGPAGVFVIQVTRSSGFFEAKGDQWNALKNGRSAPASVNLLRRVSRLARALQVYLEGQGVVLPGPVEPVLVASSPAMHIDALRPIARVVLSDAVKQFAASLLQARPVLGPELVYEVVDRLEHPRPKSAVTEGEIEAAPRAAPPVETPAPPSRAETIFRAEAEAKPFDPNDLSFAFDENAEDVIRGSLRETNPSMSLEPGARSGALRPGHWFLLGILLLVECCLLGGFGYLIFTSGR